jgi:hypothetical protein
VGRCKWEEPSLLFGRAWEDLALLPSGTMMGTRTHVACTARCEIRKRLGVLRQMDLVQRLQSERTLITLGPVTGSCVHNNGP